MKILHYYLSLKKPSAEAHIVLQTFFTIFLVFVKEIKQRVTAFLE